MSARPALSWLEALEECEAAAADAEALLVGRQEPQLNALHSNGLHSNALDPTAALARSGVDLWQSNLPPLPPDLLSRARAVHARQLQLQAELASAMTVIDQHRQLSSDGAQSRPGAMYLDCSA